PQRRLLHAPCLIGEGLYLDGAIGELRVLLHYDARWRVTIGDQFAAEVAEPDGLLAHVSVLPWRACLRRKLCCTSPTVSNTSSITRAGRRGGRYDRRRCRSLTAPWRSHHPARHPVTGWNG